MLIGILTVIFFTITVALIVTNPINIYPEIFFFSWLVKKGSIPYRDYFDDHGFLAHIFLAPFTGDSSLLYLRIIYLLLHCLNLGIFLTIIHKTKSKLAFIIGGILFILLMFFFSENDFWFELFITTFYLVTYCILMAKQFSGQFQIAGLLIGFAALVKPTAAFILLPLFLFYRNFKMVLGFILTISATAAYFSFNNAILGFLDANIGYNMFLGKHYHPPFLQENKLISSSIAIFLLCILFALFRRKVKRIILPILFFVSSYIFLASGYSPVRIVPLATFFAIIIATTLPLLKGKSKNIFLLCIICYISMMIFKDFQHYNYIHTQKPPYISDNKSQEIVQLIKQKNLKGIFFIIGNTVQPYYLLDQLPPTYLPLRYPLIEKYYPNYEKRLISDIEKNNVIYVFFPKPNEFTWTEIPKYLKKYYFLYSKSETLEVYKRITSL